ncbi:MAG TPA: PPC domain-containing protein [Actinomycetota bacterium]|jgi:hypothetical protein
MARPLARIVTLLVASAAIVLSALPAMAAPPPNDDVDGAIRVSSLPFVYEQDTTDATADGPRRCGNSSSVFFTFEPTQGGRYQVDTLGSEYDTVLTVFVRRSGSVALVTCNDDRFNLASGVRFRARPAVTYTIMVSTCCGSGVDGVGGPLVLAVDRVDPSRIRASLEVAGGSTDPVSGDLTLTGTTTCSERSIIYVEGAIRQVRNGLFVARAYLSHGVTCVPGSGAEWSIVLEPATGVVFGPGAASLRLDTIIATDGFRDVLRLPVGEETVFIS